MVRDISVISWLHFFLAFLLFLGPGYAILCFSSRQSFARIGRFSNFAIGFGFSVCFWTVLLLWLKVFQLRLGVLVSFVLCLAGWLIVLYHIIGKYRHGGLKDIWPEKIDYLELFIFLLCCIAALWGYRHEVAGLGSDSYHHTLIAEMILKDGRIPDNYLPYAPIISFSYHYGYHASVAVLGWLSGWPLRLVVVMSGPIMIAMAGLAVGLLASTITGNRVAELSAFVVVSFLAVFPAFMLNWGRYPQLLGTYLMIIFLIYFILWQRENFILWQMPWIALLAVGLSLVHYRVTIMAMVGLATYLLVEFTFRADFRSTWTKNLPNWIGALFIGVILVAPWIINTYISHQQGLSISYPVSEDSSFYSISRLGDEPINYVTNLPLCAISLVTILYGIICRKRFIIWVLLWWGALYAMSSGGLLGSALDRVSWYISLFVPAGLLSGVAIAEMARIKWFSGPIRFGGYLIGVGILVWGVSLSMHVPQPAAAYVRAADLEAMDWIKTNTPEDAIFMVNTYAFPFASEYIIGSDAGYWLPILGGRQTVVPPMSYQIERISSVDMFHNLVLLYQLKGHLTTPDAVALLRKLGITYVYIGSKGGSIQPNELLSSSDYQVEYENRSNYIFRLLPAK